VIQNQFKIIQISYLSQYQRVLIVVRLQILKQNRKLLQHLHWAFQSKNKPKKIIILIAILFLKVDAKNPFNSLKFNSNNHHWKSSQQIYHVKVLLVCKVKVQLLKPPELQKKPLSGFQFRIEWSTCDIIAKQLFEEKGSNLNQNIYYKMVASYWQILRNLSKITKLK